MLDISLVGGGAELTPFKQLISHGGYWGVAVYFLLSGYGLSESDKSNHLSFWGFSKKRISKVYIPVVVSAIVYVFVAFSTGLLPLYSTDETYLICHILWGWFDGILWFIKVILILYVIFYFQTCLCKYINQKYVSFIWFAITVIACTSFFFMFDTYMARSVPFFFIGVAASRYSEEIYKMAQKPLLDFLFFLAIILITILLRSNTIVIHTSVDIIFVLFLLILCSYTKLDFKEVNPIVSGGTYDIYLTHYKIIYWASFVGYSLSLWKFVTLVLVIATLFSVIRQPLFYIKMANRKNTFNTH